MYITLETIVNTTVFVLTVVELRLTFETDHLRLILLTACLACGRTGTISGILVNYIKSLIFVFIFQRGRSKRPRQQNKWKCEFN